MFRVNKEILKRDDKCNEKSIFTHYILFENSYQVAVEAPNLAPTEERNF